MRHRGPDDGGVFRSTDSASQVALGARRLSILDLSDAGHMPMQTSDGRYTIVYNGEVYNAPTLRRALESRGHDLRSGTDTEVVLHAFAEEGVDCLPRLNGMFAFAVWDRESETLTLARDQVGIKPLYYMRGNEGGLAFASEIKSLTALADFPRRINTEALLQYLTFLWVPDPLTMFDGILKLLPGHWARYQHGVLTVEKYWDLEFPADGAPFELNAKAVATATREQLRQAVQRQLLSDVPVGAFLSSGIDSSCIVAAMSECTSEPVRTYTISFPQRILRGELTIDDTSIAQRTADYFGCNHTNIVVEPDVVDLLPQLIYQMDDPVADPAIITAYLVCERARREVTVLLSGVGGDEVFAGYRKHRAHQLATYYQLIPSFLRRQLVERVVNGLPSMQGTALQSYVRLAKKMVRSGSLDPRERFLMDSVYFTSDAIRRLVRPEVLARAPQFDPMDQHRSYWKHVEHADFINQMLYIDMKCFMVSLNLNYNDKMSMASSLEVRVPYLDIEFMEWAAKSVSPRWKLHGGETKYALRQAARGWIPDEVLDQPKAGFGAPIAHWLAHDLHDFVDQHLAYERVESRGLFQPDRVATIVREHRERRHDHSYNIWQLLTLELWMSAYMD